MTALTLAIDAMGGDFGPRVTVPASLQALAAHSQLSLLLVGDPGAISSSFNIASANVTLRERLQIVPASSAVASDAKPSQAIRNSRGTSMRIALEMVSEGRAQACISAGNTGALMGLAKFLLKPLDGIERPALMTVLPNQNGGKTVVLDLGANVDSDSNMLAQFALMGAVMAEEMLLITRPRVALLNIGQEETKGAATIQQAATMLRALSNINYIGFIEGNDLLTGRTDVVVCDGFVGNVTLKTMEGVVRMSLSLLESSEESKKTSWLPGIARRWLQKKLIKKLNHLNPDQYNGAYLMGLRGTVIKSHGAANQSAFAMAIGQAVLAVQRQVAERMAAFLKMVLPKSDQA